MGWSRRDLLNLCGIFEASVVIAVRRSRQNVRMAQRLAYDKIPRYTLITKYEKQDIACPSPVFAVDPSIPIPRSPKSRK